MHASLLISEINCIISEWTTGDRMWTRRLSHDNEHRSKWPRYLNGRDHTWTLWLRWNYSTYNNAILMQVINDENVNGSLTFIRRVLYEKTRKPEKLQKLITFNALSAKRQTFLPIMSDRYRTTRLKNVTSWLRHTGKSSFQSYRFHFLNHPPYSLDIAPMTFICFVLRRSIANNWRMDE